MNIVAYKAEKKFEHRIMWSRLKHELNLKHKSRRK